MSKKTAFLLSSFFVFSLFAVESSKSEKSFCTHRTKADYYQKLLKEEDNNLFFNNYGGLQNGGVCWWHSRFSRNATYIALFRPDLAKPNPEMAKKIIKKIRKGSEVVTIPGYENLKDFSSDYEADIQDELEDWQIASGTIGFQWIKGLAGGTEKSAKDFKKKMDELYLQVSADKDIVYQKLQIKGITSHAWLVVGMEKITKGYKLYVVDSNYFSVQVHTYQEGMTSFSDGMYGEFMSYTNFESELNDLKKAVSKFCKK
jgi:hypothetical protein